jgi:hypothetical protein
MSSIPRFAAYAAAFEKAYASDDWSLVEPYFTEDAVYDVGPPLFGERCEGRGAILDHFRRVVDRFDKRFATRELRVIEGPREEEGRVWLRGGVRYTAPSVPDLDFELEEIATFEGDRIRRLEDRYDEATVGAIQRYVAEHGAKVGIGGA